jgi:hypothetical protein
VELRHVILQSHQRTSDGDHGVTLFFEQRGACSKANVVIVDAENAVLWERLRQLI